MQITTTPALGYIAFSAQEVEKDPVSQRIRREVTWHNIQNKSTDEVVKLVREKQIDILVDLSGHTGGNQLLSFARKPAPYELHGLVIHLPIA